MLKIIKIIGIILIVFAIASFISSSVLAFKLDSVNKELPLSSILSKGELIQEFISSIFYLIAGIGLLNLKKWARYFVILLSVNYGISIINGILIFGQQYYSTGYYLRCLFVVIFTIVLFNLNKTRELFLGKQQKINIPGKLLIGLIGVIIILKVLTVPSMLYFLKLKYPKIFELNNIIIKTIEINDKKYEGLLKDYTEWKILNCHFKLPKEYDVFSARAPSDDYFSIFFLKNGGGDSVSLFSPSIFYSTKQIAKTLKHDSDYDFMRAVYYQQWSPVCLLLRAVTKPAGVSDIKEIYEIKNNKCKGMLFKGNYYTDKSSCSGILFSNDNKLSANFTVINEGLFKNEEFNAIINSFGFNDIKEPYDELFKKGLNNYENKEYSKALIDLLNAYYKKNSKECAYYIARSFFEKSKFKEYSNLLSAEHFILYYALRIDPNYKEAKELLGKIEASKKELEEQEKRKKE